MCCRANSYRRFEWLWCLHIQGQEVETDFEASETVRPTTKNHVPVEFSLQQLRCGQLSFSQGIWKTGSPAGRTAAVL